MTLGFQANVVHHGRCLSFIVAIDCCTEHRPQYLSLQLIINGCQLCSAFCGKQTTLIHTSQKMPAYQLAVQIAAAPQQQRIQAPARQVGCRLRIRNASQRLIARMS